MALRLTPAGEQLKQDIAHVLAAHGVTYSQVFGLYMVSEYLGSNDSIEDLEEEVKEDSQDICKDALTDTLPYVEEHED
jgi:hypothetical protein